ncbi:MULTISPECIES: diguanylate cyclase [unclassified Paenibacillus]|uniref:diguanylate cyclase n=1 Tax=unclassified Paenibacillus TaxID=185978 RepID=UPI002473C01A|nr:MULTISPECIES: diguanylate cyclase [unclassified Paenibacillus]MDH6427821.1 two-component system cell cycle response regulator [Paenibacillus sp. PastH-4]MDH6444553.1 two-component system cell cycle response regulator [Paenibacillus sp. PastF-4]MDH6528450.1 two-component system cell cycle response regulator [Paenibacillus sp. PastH-3]
MTTQKYKDMVEQRTKMTLQEWTEQAEVKEKDIYRFLHNLKGTAGTVGLPDVEQFAEDTLPYFMESSLKSWSVEEWGDYLYPLIPLFNVHSLAASSSVKALDKKGPAETLTQNDILLIDDDVELVAYLKESLERQNYYVSIALSAERGLKIFYETKPDLILLDILLPDKSGIEVLNQIIGKAKKERIPIIIISGEYSKATQMQAYSLGVMDFLPKPVDIDLFLVLIKNRFQLKREWQESIIVDDLTGAFNRKHFNQVMKQLIGDFKRTNRVFSLALIDLDYFKNVNDTYGHLIGDEVLQGFSELVKNSIRLEDTFCRYGGEEFAVFLPHTDAESAMLVIQRIQERFAATDFFAKNEIFHVTISSGISEVTDAENIADKLIEEADQALYASKHAGRNQTTLYSDHLSTTKKHSVLNVIVVDDDTLIRRIVTSQFAIWEPDNIAEVKVSSYANGLDFLQSDWYAVDEKYIILLDGVMPDLDGVEVLERIRKTYPEVNILVIMLTGRNNQADIVNALQMGADDYVVKPVHMPELLSRIERLAHRFLF